MSNETPAVDAIEAGAGPIVVLVHSSAAGARQWRRLIADLEDRYRLIAVNLFGYGGTPSWSGERRQTLDDQASLVEAVLSGKDGAFSLVGHSFGASVAMKAASRLRKRMDKLILLEPNPFPLLDQNGRAEAFAEILGLREAVERAGRSGHWASAAETFADYWGGDGTWAAMADDRRTSFAEFLRPNFHEWDAVMGEATTLTEWAASLPGRTLVVSDPRTVRPIREIVALMRDRCPAWHFDEIPEGGHMAPLTRPDLINPIVAAFLDGRR